MPFLPPRAGCVGFIWASSVLVAGFDIAFHPDTGATISGDTAAVTSSRRSSRLHPSREAFQLPARDFRLAEDTSRAYLAVASAATGVKVIAADGDSARVAGEQAGVGRINATNDVRGDSYYFSLSGHAHPKHRVEHVASLNKDSLWYLMAVTIVCIGMVCVHLETLTQAYATGRSTNPFYGSWKYFMRLIFCAVGLNLSMLFWGIAQEYMMTNAYMDHDGNEETLSHSMVLVFSNRVMSVAFCGFILWLQSSQGFMPPVESIGPASTNLLASWFQYQSLVYVSFPLQTVAKSAKLLPVMCISSLRGKRHTSLDYTEAVLIVSSVVVFGLETDHDIITADPNSTKVGLLLLCGLLLFDSVTPHLQDAIFKKHDKLSALQITFSMALFAAVLGFLEMLCSSSLVSSFAFFLRHRDAFLHLIVLSLCSTTTQFLISYTIKHFGPVSFSIIATTRQLSSVMFSNVLFKHNMTGVAWLAAALVFVTLLWRALRPHERCLAREGNPGSDEEESLEGGDGGNRGGGLLRGTTMSSPVLKALSARSTELSLLVCVLGMHVPMALYSILQEFLATHTFDGVLFRYPLFLIAMNRTGATLLAICVLKAQGTPVYHQKMLFTIAPAGVNLFATFCQYEALYYMLYPAQVLIKSVKVIPVMLAGRVLRNRTYTQLDYIEAAVITALVCVFMWNCGAHAGRLSEPGSIAGIALMLLYVFADSFTSNVEDMIYQHERLDPAQLLLGMQAISGAIAWALLASSGQLAGAVGFLLEHNAVIIHICVLVLAQAFGAYACTLTVKLFGPAVFTLLLMAHQIESFIVSVYLFNHNITGLNCVLVAIVGLMILSSSLRRAEILGPKLSKADHAPQFLTDGTGTVDTSIKAAEAKAGNEEAGIAEVGNAHASQAEQPVANVAVSPPENAR